MWATYTAATAFLMDTLKAMAFDKKIDRLFSVGDLIDRGLESFECLSLPYEPWFFAVRGNHEVLMHEAMNGGDEVNWLMNGGTWSLAHDRNDLRVLINDVMDRMPLALEVGTASGRVGIIHADVTSGQWGEFDALRDVWSRERVERSTGKTLGPVKGIDTVYVGHSILKEVTRIDNVVYLDTGAYRTGNLQIVKISGTA
ncbi:putative serine/threonine protein phosphatase [Marinobacter sp. ELB17]|nr:putative serine/threonine protein phosphatase [Marinobacter sp. ELB17]